MDVKLQHPEPPTAAAATTSELQRRYWAALRPIVPMLSDRELSLLALLVFWSGPKAVPGDRILKSWRTIAPRMGSNRISGKQSANRQALGTAAGRLGELGLVERSGTDAVWRVIPEPEISQTMDASAPNWPGFAAFNERLWRREFDGAMSTRAAICRLSFELDAAGGWSGSVADFAGLLAVGPQTARKRIGEIMMAENALELREQLEDGKLQVQIHCKFEAPRTSSDTANELIAAKDAIWFPELMQEIVARAGRLLKSGRVSSSRELTGFYEPVLALQTEFGNPPLLRYALEETLKNGVLDGIKGQANTNNWHRYTRKICVKHRHRFPRAADADLEVVSGPITNTDAPPEPQTGQVRQMSQQSSLRERELEMRDLLRKAARLNGTGEGDKARKLLKQEIGPKIAGVAERFDGNIAYCRAAIALAFKQGSTDFVGVKPDQYALDYFPEWSPKRWPPA